MSESEYGGYEVSDPHDPAEVEADQVSDDVAGEYESEPDDEAEAVAVEMTYESGAEVAPPIEP
jgi:hypothetical protein